MGWEIRERLREKNASILTENLSMRPLEALGCGDVRLVKCFFKFETAFEIINAVALILAEVTDGDEVINDVADVLALVQPPLPENGVGHRAVLCQRMNTHALKHLLARDVLIFLSGAKMLGGYMQSITHKLVSVGMVSRVFFRSLGNGVMKRDLRHLQ